jgi:hypothetical protein
VAVIANFAITEKPTHSSIYVELVSGVKAYRFGLWGLGYEVVQGDNDLIYPLIVLFNVEHEELP